MSNLANESTFRAADAYVRKAIAVDGELYKALLVLARIDKGKVEDSTDKMLVMRAHRMVWAIQEVNADKSLPKVRL